MTDLREQVIATAREMNRRGLNHGTSGNVSARSSPDRFLITPSAIPYEQLVADDIVEIGLDGQVVRGARKPSTEWRLHLEILRARPEVDGVVHTHSLHAVAIACTRRPIPAFHYMVALAGGADVRCAEYATYGTDELARNTVAALAGRKACLLANHGLVAVGTGLASALSLAEGIEVLSAQYWHALQIGPPVILDDAEMARVMERIASYGRPER
jgi:L-fuculose-phosphate aldolase